MKSADSSSKICTFIALAEQVRSLRIIGVRIVATSGAFDLWHEGHALYLEDAARHGDVLVVGVDSDELIRQRKGPKRPICGQDSRLIVVAAQAAVDYAIVIDDWSIFVRLASPDIIVVSPTTGDDANLVQRELARSVGAEIAIVPSRSGNHTSGLIDSIVERYGGK